MAQETKVTRNITLDPETDALVVAKRDEMAAVSGDENYSAAMRTIIREWAKTQAIIENLKREQARA